MLWIKGKVSSEVGFKAKNEVQILPVSEQFKGMVDFALGTKKEWSKIQRKITETPPKGFICFFLN